MKQILALALLITLFIGCSNVQVYQRPDYVIDYSMYIPPSKEEELSYKMWYYTNIERENNGLNVLYWDDDLAKIAYLHSKDMAERGCYDHANLDGENPANRAVRYGYKIKKFISPVAYTEGIGENLGQVTPGNIEDFRKILNTTDDMAKAQVEMWMNSPKHRENILDEKYDKIGIACVWNGSLYLVTQVFW